jgi:DNA polymerase-3 subunit delta
LNFRQFKKSAQDPEAAYLFVTDQEYLKDKMIEFCEEQVEESSRAFDWAIFDLAKEKSVDVKERLQNLINTARTLPWMNEHRWIYVKNAHHGGKELGEYLENPAPKTVLVLESPKKVRSWPGLAMVETAKGTDHVSWLIQTARREGFTMSPEAAETLVSMVGDELSRLAAELEKQFLWSLDSKTITVDSVLGLAVEARGRDIFELISAMAGQRSESALRILTRLFETGTSHQQILSMLYWNFRRLLVAKEMMERGEPFFDIVKKLKIWSYRNRQHEVQRYSRKFLSGVLLKLREADRLFKSTGTEPKTYLERVIIDTCGNAFV